MPKFVVLHDAVNKAYAIRVDADAIQYYGDTGTDKPTQATTLHFYGGNALNVSETPEEVDGIIKEVCEGNDY